jgi:hypothetical protein
MALNREQILDTLLARLMEKVPGLRTYSRRDQDFDSIPKPAMLLLTDSMQRDDLGRWTIGVTVDLFVVVPANDKSPETRLNELIDLVDDALDADAGDRPSGTGRTTLGGLVGSVEISGEIQIAQGVGGIGEATIPLQIVAFEAD